MPPLSKTGCAVYRIIPSIFPPVSLFDRVSDPADLEAIYYIEALTNDRLRDEVGDIRLVPTEDRVTGPGSTPIMAAFTHINPAGGRFSTGEFSAYYAALELATAIAETRFHREAFLRASNEKAIDLDMRVYVADLNCELHDVRDWEAKWPSIYDPSSYSAGQSLGRSLRSIGSNGILYNSVRLSGGTCAAVYRPRCISKARQERHLAYRWDGNCIRDVYEKREFREI